ncbi:hypothetical protein ACI5FR_29565 [Paenibacillus sp. HJGM_3]
MSRNERPASFTATMPSATAAVPCRVASIRIWSAEELDCSASLMHLHMLRLPPTSRILGVTTPHG